MRKRLLLILVALLNLKALATGLNLTTKTNVLSLVGDSYWADGNPGSLPVVAPYSPDYIFAIVASQHPTNFVIFDNDAQGGVNPDGMLTNHFPIGVFSYQGYRSNNFDHFVFVKSTENGGVVISNTYFLSWSNMCQAPKKMSDGSSLTLNTISGWASTATYSTYGLSDFPSLGASGNPLLTTHGIQSSGATNATVLYGAGAIDIIGNTYTASTNDYALYGGTHFWVTNAASAKLGHPYQGGQLLGSIAVAQQICDDTNIANRTISWTDGSVVSTNHCYVVLSGKTDANTLMFTNKDDRTTWAWDVSNVALNMTNDDSAAFSMNASAADAIVYSFQINNLPANHTFSLVIGGLTVGTFTSFQLSTGSTGHGLNLFTNQNTPQWSQAVEGLGCIRDYEGCNRTNLIQRPAGDGVGIVWVNSSIGGRAVLGDRGDTLLANTAPFIDRLQTNMIAVHNQFQPTNLVWQVVDLGLSTFQPAPFR